MVIVELYQQEQLLSRATIATAFIDAEGFTQVRLPQPVHGDASVPWRVRLLVSEALTGRLALLQRQVDESFDATQAIFRVDGVTQVNPIAHQAYFSYRPAFAIHLSGIFLLGALLLVLPQRLTKYWLSGYAVALALISIAPAVTLYHYPVTIFLAIMLVWLGMYLMLRREGLGRIPSMIGAHSASLTTYFPLHLLQGHTSVLWLAALPLTAAVLHRRRGRWLALCGLVMAAIVLLPSQPHFTENASLRDIFLDPNQSHLALKISGADIPWYHFGSYVGILGAGLAFVGAASFTRKRRTVMGLLAIGLILVYFGDTFFPSVRIPWPYLIIIPTYCLAFLAGAGADAMQRYLGNDRAAKLVVAAVGVIILLDLLFVFSQTLESYYL